MNAERDPGDAPATPEVLEALYPRSYSRMAGAISDPDKVPAGVSSEDDRELVEYYKSKGLNEETARKEAERSIFLRKIYGRSMGKRPTKGWNE